MEDKVKKLHSYRWIIWGILSLCYVIVFFHRLAVGVVRDNLVNEFNISSTTFANLGSAYFYSYMLMQIPAGILADTLGARYTVTIGTALAGIGSIVFGIAPSIGIAFVGRLLVGIGVSVVFIAILKVQTEWFYEREFGTMSGLTSFVGNLGGILAQTPLVILVSILTWRYTFIMIGAVSIVIAIMAFIIVRNKPAQMGLPSIMDLEGRKVGPQRVKIFDALIDVCKNPNTWPPFFLFAGFFGAYVALTGTWGQSYLIGVYKISKISAANYIMLGVIGLSIGSFIIGGLSDRIKLRKKPILAFGTAYIIAWLSFVYLRPQGIILGINLFILGFSCSAFVLGWACGKEANNPKFAGMSTSVVNIGGFVGAAIVPLILGGVIDKYGKLLSPEKLYSRAFLYCILSSLIGYLFIFFIKETECKNIWKLQKPGE